ncbi:MAG TPA: hypothetical protein VEG60_02330 [Candidatus Binatia bacterium]|nr:hypothetical protein [Candidatus Binatia bacterium]
MDWKIYYKNGTYRLGKEVKRLFCFSRIEFYTEKRTRYDGSIHWETIQFKSIEAARTKIEELKRSELESIQNDWRESLPWRLVE